MVKVHSASFMIWMLLIIYVLFPVPGAGAAEGSDPPPPINVNSPQLPFILNDGQLNREVAFYTSMLSGTVYVMKDGDPGSDPSRWCEGVQAFRGISLGRKYDLIDVKLAAVKGTVEKILTVHPGGNVASFRSRFLNARSMSILPTGHLVVRSPVGTIQFSPPIACQVKNGKRCDVSVSYQLYGSDYGFNVGRKDPAATAVGASYPRIEARPDPCEFGEVKKGTTVLRTVTVTNAGRGDLYLSRVMLKSGDTGPFMIEKNTCSGTVLAGVLSGADLPSSCEVQVVFTPERTGKARTRLRLSSSDPVNSVHGVRLAGTGIEAENHNYPGFWGWIAIMVLVLRMVLGVPVSARGWGHWMGKA